jgi:hypothetical protein
VSSKVRVICGVKETMSYVVLGPQYDGAPPGDLGAPVAIRTRFRFKIIRQPLPIDGGHLCNAVRGVFMSATEGGFSFEIENDSDQYVVGRVYDLELE